jgi:hypothetical protein
LTLNIDCAIIFLKYIIGANAMARIARNKISGEYFHILLSGLSELNIFAEHRMKQYYITRTFRLIIRKYEPCWLLCTG